MKLENLERIKQISTKNVMVNEVLGGLEKQFYYNIFQLKINLALVILTIFGNTEIHKVMNSEDVDWLLFVNENYALVEELEKGEYAEDFNEILREIVIGADKKAQFFSGIGGMLENLGELFTEENLNKVKDVVAQNSENVEK